MLIIPEHPTTDALASALALMMVLKKTNHPIQLVSPGYSVPTGHEFLPHSTNVDNQLSNLQKYVITVNIGQTKLDTLSYDVHGDQVHIYLTPKSGAFQPKDVVASSGRFAFDLIITLGLSSLEKLGPTYSDNAEFFYQTPIINLDHQATNGRYGHTNLIDVTATSLAEMVFDLTKTLDGQIIDEPIATCLLTGIMANTKAFQSNTVTPRSLSIASQLMAANARREDIVRHLYQTKSLATLKLWGRTLAKIQSSADSQIVWSVINRHDLEVTKASTTEGPGVIEELMVNAPTAKYVCLFMETPDGTAVHIKHQPDVTLPPLPESLRVESPQYITGAISEPITVVEKNILQILAGKK